MDTALWNDIDQKIRRADIDGAITLLERLLTMQGKDRFMSLVGSKFTNPPEQVLAYINDFIGRCQSDFNVRSVYIEMNEFDINYDPWFFSGFGFDKYKSDPNDLDWMSDSPVEDEQYETLTGLESVQADFRWYHEERDKEDTSYDRAQELAMLLVIVKFIALVQAALSIGQLAKPIPVLATCYGCDTVGRFEPGSSPLRRVFRPLFGR